MIQASLSVLYAFCGSHQGKIPEKKISKTTLPISFILREHVHMSDMLLARPSEWAACCAFYRENTRENFRKTEISPNKMERKRSLPWPCAGEGTQKSSGGSSIGFVKTFSGKGSIYFKYLNPQNHDAGRGVFCASRIEGKSKVNGEAQSKTKIVEMRLNVCNLKTAKKYKTDAFLLNAKTLGPKEEG